MAYKFQSLAATMSGSLTQEGSLTIKDRPGVTQAIITDAGAVSGSSTLEAGGALTTAGTVKFLGVADTAVAVVADSMYFLDADGLMKSERLTDYATAIAGPGLGAVDGVLEVDIDEFSALGGTGLHQTQDHFLFSDNGTEKKITFSNLQDAVFADVSGDATIAAGGALTIAAQAVENSMLADDAVGADELADNAVTLAKMAGLARGKIIYGDASGDPAALAAGADGKLLVADGNGDLSWTSVSGDATLSAGALTIAANAIQTGMVHDDVATELAGVGLTDSSGVLAVAVSGAVHVSSDKVALSGSVAGTGLTYTGGVDSILTLALDIDELSALGGTGVAQGDHFLFSDGGTEKKITASNLEDWIFGNVSGDATVAAGGALTIAADAVEPSMMNIFDDSLAATTTHFMIADGTDYSSFALSGDVTCTNAGVVTIAAAAVENSMLADDAVGADELAANAVVNASIAAGAAIDLDKLDGGSCASALTDLAQGDLIYAGDVDASNAIKSITFSNLEDAIFGNISGDATIAAGGALTLGAGVVEHGMLADDIISGQAELAADGMAAADELMISDAGTIKRIGVDTIFTDGPGLLTAATVAVADDHFMFLDGGATGDAKTESLVDLVAAMAGAGLSAASGQLTITGNNVAQIADSGTVAEGYNYFADLSSDAAVTMPASPTVGDVCTIKAGNLTSSAVITINKAGSQTLDGLTALVIESPYGAVTLVYVANNTWRIV